MSMPFFLPGLGSDDSTEGEIISLVEIGSRVTAGDTVMEVETDKVVLDIPAPTSGTVGKLRVKVGDKVTGGMLVGSIIQDATDTATDVNGSRPDVPISTQQDAPAAQEPLPATTTTPQAATSDMAATSSFSPSERKTSNPAFALSADRQILAHAGPAARRMARQLGIDINKVTGSGERMRISKDDVVTHARRVIQDKSASPVSRARRERPDPAQHGPVHRAGLSGIAKATGRNMSLAWSEIPHAWVQEDIDITDLEALRKIVKARAAGDMPLTVTAILCKVIAMALRRFPSFNSVLDTDTDEIIYRDYTNIGVAVDTPRGLVVPCLRDVDSKTAIEIGNELKAISKKAVDAKLAAEDFQGSGFTISNLGGLGAAGIFPVVNWPEVAILGVASSRERCMPHGEVVRNRLVMPVTLGFDHRVINGADAARFLTYVKTCIEEPGMLLIGL